MGLSPFSNLVWDTVSHDATSHNCKLLVLFFSMNIKGIWSEDYEGRSWRKKENWRQIKTESSMETSCTWTLPSMGEIITKMHTYLIKIALMSHRPFLITELKGNFRSSLIHWRLGEQHCKPSKKSSLACSCAITEPQYERKAIESFLQHGSKYHNTE